MKTSTTEFSFLVLVYDKTWSVLNIQPHGCNVRFYLTVPTTEDGIFLIERASKSCSVDWVTFMNDFFVTEVPAQASVVYDKIVSTIVSFKLYPVNL